MFPWAVNVTIASGPVQAGSRLVVPEGYSALVGRNNAGKTAVLQAIFRAAMQDGGIGHDRVAWLLSDRNMLLPTAEVGGRSLAAFNDELARFTQSTSLLGYDQQYGPSRAELFRLLVSHQDLRRQLDRLDRLLDQVELPPLGLRYAQQLHFDDIAVGQQGSGLRAILPILAAITDESLRLLLIDEPEASLEPALQRRLAAVLVAAASADRPIVVATHSNLLLNRGDPRSVWVVDRTNGVTTTTQLQSLADLLDVTFRLLGNSTVDLFLPGNFWIVEGASDQEIAERVLELHGYAPGTVKVLSAEGIDGVAPSVAAVERVLVPLVAGASPYTQRVVVLVDGPLADKTVRELRRLLRRRLHVLGAASLEEYLPEELYVRAGLDKGDVRRQLNAAGSYAARATIKASVSRSIAAAMRPEDLSLLPEFAEAATQAANAAAT